MKKKIFASILLTLMMVTMCFTTAFAADGDAALSTDMGTWIEENIVSVSNGSVTGKEAWIKTYITADAEKAAKDNGSPIQIGTFTYGTQSGIFYLMKGKTMEGLTKQINQSNNNSKTVEGVTDITDGLSITADTGGAANLLHGFTPLISLGLGILVTLTTIGMTIYSACDVAYIAFPVIRNKCEDMKMEGEGIGVHKKANGESALIFISDEAQYAVQQGSIESGKSPWAIYFGKRIVSYVLLAIILFILLTGNISLITNIAIKVVSGIMNVLGGLA